MHYTLEMLAKGKGEKIVEWFKFAACHWDEIWAKTESKELETLARRLTTEQAWFEHNCGGRWIGQEIMVICGFALLYSTAQGFGANEDRARLLYDAFLCSLCSVEVKSAAGELAASYDLIANSAY